MNHSWIWPCMIILYLFQPCALWFCSQHTGCYDNTMQFPVHKVLLATIWGTINMGWWYKPRWNESIPSLAACWRDWHIMPICFLILSVSPHSLPFSHIVCLCTCFFPHSLSLSWHWHFHLLPWGLEMSLREVLVRLSGSSRALWLWQTSFNWEEARRVWKNWNIHETPFIRHNLNSAWKKPYMYKEKSTSLLLCVLPSSPPGTGRLLRDSIFSFF